MFRRRRKITVPQRMRDLIWPRLGWVRWSRYVLHRVGRLPGTAHTIAAGFACGAAVSFTPFVGLHFVLGALLAWAIRGNILSSAIGTAVGNPWTFPFIWIWIYELGRWFGAGTGPAHGKSFDFSTLFGEVLEALLRLDLVYMMETAAPILWPMLVGSLPTAAVAWAGFYFLVKPVIATYQRQRLRRRLRRAGAEGETQS